MRIERQFNMTSAKQIEVDEPIITIGGGHALGIKVRFKASNAADGIAIGMTPDEARKLAQRLIDAAWETEK
jgi:hypothetical protein